MWGSKWAVRMASGQGLRGGEKGDLVVGDHDLMDGRFRHGGCARDDAFLVWADKIGDSGHVREGGELVEGAFGIGLLFPAFKRLVEPVDEGHDGAHHANQRGKGKPYVAREVGVVADAEGFGRISVN